LEISPVETQSVAAVPAAMEPQPKPRRSRLRRLRVLLSPLFFISVLLPTAVASVYYGLIASDTFVSESRFVVRSPQWNFNVSGGDGAVTWVSGTTGLNGVVSAANSLVGSKTSDHVGSQGVTVLTNGNYVVDSPFWNNSAAMRAGAVTWANGATGLVGVVDATNSLVGTNSNDQIGDNQRRATRTRNLIDGLHDRFGELASELLHVQAHRFGGAVEWALDIGASAHHGAHGAIG